MLSFGELARVQNTVGVKAFQDYYHKTDKTEKSESSKPKKTELKKRENKNQPTEMSSKRPVTRKRVIVQETKKPRDPRFEGMSGVFNPDIFDRSYGFIYEMEENELKELKKEIEKTKDLQKKQELSQEYNVRMSRLNARKLKEKRQEIKREVKKEEMEKVKQGKKPFFLKKGDLKKIELTKKFQEMKSKGKDVDKYLEQKRKRKAQKQHVKIPKTRRSQNE